MPARAGKSFTSDHMVAEDRSVSFRCSSDAEQWRWLALPPSHPIFIQTFNYYISVECSAARGTLDPAKWSALTWMDWELGEAAAKLPVRGVMENRIDDDKLGFGIALYSDDDGLVFRTRGRGVVFRNRDFEGWRKQSKDRIAAQQEPPAFDYADREAVGALMGEQVLIGGLQERGAIYADGLITEANGMPPGSRYLDGSGDHVNAVHLAEAARQFCALLTGTSDIQLNGGEISFSRYVEFNVPFRILLTEQIPHEIAMSVEQAGKPCTSMIYRLS